LVTGRLDATGRTIEDYEPIFDQAIAVNAKSFVLLMAMALSLVTPLVFYRARQPLAVHAVFSLHFFAFLMLLICCLLPAAILALAGGASGRSGGAAATASSV
jgi:hypothetical protein